MRKNTKIYSQQEMHEFERAVTFLCKWINSGSTNPKPVIWHSIRVANTVYELKPPAYVVICALLHDVVEDTKCKPADIRRAFGSKVAKIVQTLTFDDSLHFIDRWQQGLPKIHRAGKWAMIIKTADCLDNINYYASLVKSKKTDFKILWRYKLVIKEFTPYLRSVSIFKEFSRNVAKLNK